MRVVVFLHGTAIMHSGGLGKTPEERGRQVEENEASVQNYENYVPVDAANEKLKKWTKQGAEIIYLSSHQNRENIKKDKKVITNYNFPNGPILYRHNNETYADIAERIMPDILIEDDCKSIGGKPEMTFPNIDPQKQHLIKSIVVKEFSGIDNLPDNLEELKNFQ